MFVCEASVMKGVRGLKVVSEQSRGVTLVLAAFFISILILSTQIYIYRLGRTSTYENYDTLSDYILSIEQGSRHVVVASLINVTHGGSVSNFVYNLNRWESFVASDYKFGRCTLNSTIASKSPYSGGIWLSWGTEGMGVSSASAVLEMDLAGRGVEVDWSFTENITTTMLVSGRFETVQANIKRVTVFVNIVNEGAPALAGSIDLTYLREEWRYPTLLDDYVETDYGNGTYRFSFSDEFQAVTEIIVRVQAYDCRGIFVQAENIFTLEI